jgi:hypothetical protein
MDDNQTKKTNNEKQTTTKQTANGKNDKNRPVAHRCVTREAVDANT